MYFQCSCCGQTHESWPALIFKAPDQYASLSPDDKQNIGQLSSDFCVIEHEDQVDYFIRVVFTQKVIDGCQYLEYGVWVSLSEKSYADYAANFHRDDYETGYFGWLCNQIRGYVFPQFIPTNVVVRTGGQRPEIFPKEDFDHPFVRDFYNGISVEEAERRIGKWTEVVALRN